MSYEGRPGFFECRANRTKTFNGVGYLVKFAHTPLSVRKDLESSFHHRGGPVKLVHATFVPGMISKAVSTAVDVL